MFSGKIIGGGSTSTKNLISINTCKCDSRNKNPRFVAASLANIKIEKNQLYFFIK